MNAPPLFQGREGDFALHNTWNMKMAYDYGSIMHYGPTFNGAIILNLLRKYLDLLALTRRLNPNCQGI